MKKIILLIMIMGASVGTYAQELRSAAIKVKQEIPEQYEIIKKWSEKVWEGDNVMIIDEINVQCEAFFDLAEVVDKNLGKGYVGTLLIEGLQKFSHEGWEEHNRKMIDTENIKIVHVNWVDVYIFVNYEVNNR
jgi:hypothetical protein